ncbi:hypothetical protein KM043_008310 [Ampulex compressa]|nr:hypothetical protein KM043_008310 [Ampulex compressa]
MPAIHHPPLAELLVPTSGNSRRSEYHNAVFSAVLSPVVTARNAPANKRILINPTFGVFGEPIAKPSLVPVSTAVASREKSSGNDSELQSSFLQRHFR